MSCILVLYAVKIAFSSETVVSDILLPAIYCFSAASLLSAARSAAYSVNQHSVYPDSFELTVSGDDFSEL